jgi:hypothetical protein
VASVPSSCIEGFGAAGAGDKGSHAHFASPAGERAFAAAGRAAEGRQGGAAAIATAPDAAAEKSDRDEQKGRSAARKATGPENAAAAHVVQTLPVHPVIPSVTAAKARSDEGSAAASGAAQALVRAADNELPRGATLATAGDASAPPSAGPQRRADGATPSAAREAMAAAAPPPAPVATAPLLPPPAAPMSVANAVMLAAAPPAPPAAPLLAAPLYDLAAEDPSLRAVALGKNARLTLETADGGALSLHLQVRDGIADLRVDGDAARALDLRPEGVRAALAGEGITLGTFQSSAPFGGSADAAPAGTTAGSQTSPSASDGAGGTALSDAGAGSRTGADAAADAGAGRHGQGQGGDRRQRSYEELDDRHLSADGRRGSSGITAGRATTATAAGNTTTLTDGRRRHVHVTA